MPILPLQARPRIRQLPTATQSHSPTPARARPIELSVKILSGQRIVRLGFGHFHEVVMVRLAAVLLAALVVLGSAGQASANAPSLMLTQPGVPRRSGARCRDTSTDDFARLGPVRA